MATTTKVSPHQTTLDQILQQRGIATAAVRANWTVGEYQGKPGWYYPVYGLDGLPLLTPDSQRVVRFKNADSKATPKYVRPRGNQLKGGGVANYYTATENLRRAIEQESGLLIIANGEPAVLTWAEAGIENVLCWFGEGNIPKTLVEDLTALNVQRVYLWPDRDDTGYESAAKVMRLLQDTDIDFVAFQWPFEDGSGWDVNNLWVDDPDPDMLKMVVGDVHKGGSVPPLFPVITAELMLWLPLQTPDPQVTDDGKLPAQFLADIQQALGVHGFTSMGWSKKPVRCLFGSHEHDDVNPAARWNQRDSVLHCFKCGKGYLAKDVGAKLGFDLASYYAKEREQNGVRVPTQLKLPEGTDIKTLFTTDADQLQIVRQQIDGLLLPEGTPILGMIPILHGFGGYAEWHWTRQMGMIVGGTGTGKTSLAHDMMMHEQLQGGDVVLWTPEWTPLRMAYRDLFRHTENIDFSILMRHLVYLSEKSKGITDGLGIELKSGLKDQGRAAINKLVKLAGRIHQPAKPMNFEQILEAWRLLIPRLRNEGRVVRVAVWDYLQLMERAGGAKDWTYWENIVLSCKQFCEELDVWGWLLSQPRKDDDSKMREGQLMGIASAQGVSSQKPNLVVTLALDYGDDMQPLGSASMRVVKNNMGRTGVENMIPVSLDHLTYFARQ